MLGKYLKPCWAIYFSFLVHFSHIRMVQQSKKHQIIIVAEVIMIHDYIAFKKAPKTWLVIHQDS